MSRSTSRKKTSGPSTAKVNFCSPSCPRLHKKKAAPFQRTAHGARENVPFKRFLGCDRGPDGNLVVNPEQAVIVKRIYSMFLQGMIYHGIAKQLTEDGIPTPGGKTSWNQSAVKSILSNEKYKGDTLLQKTYTTDFLTKKTKVNEGEIPQYAEYESFFKTFKQLPDSLEEFSIDSWNSLVEYATIYSTDDIRFTFKNGQEIKA